MEIGRVADLRAGALTPDGRRGLCLRVKRQVMRRLRVQVQACRATTPKGRMEWTKRRLIAKRWDSSRNALTFICGADHPTTIARAALNVTCRLLVLCCLVAKRPTTTAFFVERTDYGWSVRVGADRVGLFATQRHALADVQRRRADLKSKGQSTTLVVSGSEPETPPGTRSLRPFHR